MTARKGDSWAKLAREIYGDERYALALAQANGARSTTLRLGADVLLPDLSGANLKRGGEFIAADAALRSAERDRRETAAAASYANVENRRFSNHAASAAATSAAVVESSYVGDITTGVPYDEFGLFTMPGSGPIWNTVVNPVARVVGGIGPAMHEFKAGALNQLEYEGQEAAHAGDESALRWAAARHTLVDLLLPGSPQEVALGLAGGAVIGKVVGKLGGTLTRMASESTSFKFMAADLGELAGTQLEQAALRTAQVFRPTRTASDMSFEQVEALKDLTHKVYSQLLEAGNSHSKLSPALSVAQDVVTGEVRLGLNNRFGAVPENLSPQLESRMLQMPDDVRFGYIQSHGPGSHAEIYAANDLLLARPGAQLSEIAVYTIETAQKTYRGLYKPPCRHCEYLLDGVHVVE
jgi:hypothetical protein